MAQRGSRGRAVTRPLTPMKPKKVFKILFSYDTVTTRPVTPDPMDLFYDAVRKSVDDDASRLVVSE